MHDSHTVEHHGGYHRSTEVDAGDAAYDDHPADEPHEWGDLAPVAIR